MARNPITSKEEYREHVARVPGVFGDLDTSGTASPGTEVPTKNEEQASANVAEVETAIKEEENNEATKEVPVAEARRQTDVAGGQPSAEEVEEGAEAQETEEETEETEESESENDSDESDSNQTTEEENQTTEEENNEEGFDREALEARAHELGIQGNVANFRDETLISKVEEAEKDSSTD